MHNLYLRLRNRKCFSYNSKRCTLSAYFLLRYVCEIIFLRTTGNLLRKKSLFRQQVRDEWHRAAVLPVEKISPPDNSACVYGASWSSLRTLVPGFLDFARSPKILRVPQYYWSLWNYVPRIAGGCKKLVLWEGYLYKMETAKLDRRKRETTADFYLENFITP